MPDEKKPVPYSTVHGVEKRPDLPATKQVPKADPTTANYGALILEKLEKMSTSQANTVNALNEFGQKLGSIEREVESLKDWRRETGKQRPLVIGPGGEPRTASGTTLEAVNDKVKTLSGRDLSQEAAIGMLVADVTELKKSQTAQTKMLTSIYQDGLALWNDPKVKMLRGLVWMLLAAWAAKKGIKVGE